MLTLKLGRAKVPMIVTNHTYDVIGSMFPQKEMGGGSGLKYAAFIYSSIYLRRKKKKEQKLLEISFIVRMRNQDLQLRTES